MKKVFVMLALVAGLGGVVVVAQAVSSVADRSATFSHEQLEADRLMTLQMSTNVGGAMDIQMPREGMLERSSNEAYVKALEQHIRLYNQMAGLTR